MTTDVALALKNYWWFQTTSLHILRVLTWICKGSSFESRILPAKSKAANPVPEGAACSWNGQVGHSIGTAENQSKHVFSTCSSEGFLWRSLGRTGCVSCFTWEKGVGLKLERELTWSSMALHSKGKMIIPRCFLEFNIFLDKYIF